MVDEGGMMARKRCRRCGSPIGVKRTCGLCPRCDYRKRKEGDMNGKMEEQNTRR